MSVCTVWGEPEGPVKGSCFNQASSRCPPSRRPSVLCVVPAALVPTLEQSTATLGREEQKLGGWHSEWQWPGSVPRRRPRGRCARLWASSLGVGRAMPGPCLGLPLCSSLGLSVAREDLLFFPHFPPCKPFPLPSPLLFNFLQSFLCQRPGLQVACPGYSGRPSFLHPLYTQPRLVPVSCYFLPPSSPSFHHPLSHSFPGGGAPKGEKGWGAEGPLLGRKARPPALP